MTTETNKPKLGDSFYLITGGKKYRREITYLSADIFEWDCGWARVADMVINTDTKSKVKYVLDQDKGCIKLGKGYVFISDVKTTIAEVLPDGVFTDEELYKVLSELPSKHEANPTQEIFELIECILHETISSRK
jgi:hypothetical protein